MAHPALTGDGRDPAIPLPPVLRAALVAVAVIDLGIGALFLFGPELRLTPWPSPISPVLTRFIGAIVIANGGGIVVGLRQGNWQGVRVLFYVALTYGLIVLLAVPYALFTARVDQVLWGYVAVDAIFLAPIVALVVRYERERLRGRDR